jgi:hypothetical protein
LVIIPGSPAFIEDRHHLSREWRFEDGMTNRLKIDVDFLVPPSRGNRLSKGLQTAANLGHRLGTSGLANLGVRRVSAGDQRSGWAEERLFSAIHSNTLTLYK